ncbi:cell division protein FtsL [Enterovirga sp. CN4-39]|uniref:cell division protein FtsL n=1 Tax=Enterovirga sp. CN4-39 TaxID=3400910 RepID=UPI003C0C1674
MIRFLHILAITGLIGSAAWAYSIKYDTLYYAEEVVKLRRKIERERDAIAVAKAEMALLTRPDRLQRLADQNLDLQPLGIYQLGTVADLPQKPAKSDAIGMKLEALFREPTATPKDRRTGDARTPTTTGSLPKAPIR